MERYEEVVAAWRSWGIQTLEDLTQCLNTFYVPCLTESNNIDSENVNLAVAREAMLLDITGRHTGSLHVLIELANAMMCYSLMCKRFSTRTPITVDLITEFHATMLAGCYNKHLYVELEERPGVFRWHDFVVGTHEVGIDPRQIPSNIEELVQELKEFQEKDTVGYDVLTAGAYLHGKFEHIHPFADGNGRVGRMLLNYWLVLNNHPPITIFAGDRYQYYTALQKYDEDDDLSPLFEFLQRQTVKTWPVYR